MMRLGIKLLILQHATLPDILELKTVTSNSINLLRCWVSRRNCMSSHRGKEACSIDAWSLAGFGRSFDYRR